MGEEDIRELIEKYHNEEFSKKLEEELLEYIDTYYGMAQWERWIVYSLLALTILEAIKLFMGIL